MNEDRNQHQIIRKDARNCFVESLNDAFEIGRIHLAFATYDLSRPIGQRQTNNIHIYIAVDEFWNYAASWKVGNFAICWRIRRQAGIKHRFISAWVVLLPKSLQNTGVPGQMEKACPEQHSYWQEANRISCL